MTLVEVVAASAAIVLDLLVPSLVLLCLAFVSLLVRRTSWSSLGLCRPRRGLVARMLAFAVVWSLFQLGVAIPIANHLSGTEQDLGEFEALEGNVGRLLVFLVLGWVIGALVEEIAFRGYLLTRLRELVGGGTVGLLVSVVVSSLLFGRVHSEQGAVGVVVVALDGVAWCALRYRHGTLWAPVLAHGWNNTIGFCAFYLVGPIHGLW